MSGRPAGCRPAANPRVSIRANCVAISSADKAPSGSYQWQIQFKAPAMENAAIFGSHGTMVPSSIPSWMKERSPAIDLPLVFAHLGERVGGKVGVVQPHDASPELTVMTLA